LRSRARVLPLALLTLACLSPASSSEKEVRISDALEDLRAGGFEFEADVRFRVDELVVCEGIACADLVVIQERRTILLAPEALRSHAAVRATLLEIWERYREPRPGSLLDLARGALRVALDGERVGVNDHRLLSRARLVYGQLYRTLPPGRRTGLPDPDTLGLR
jgi:hypothetical protein